MKTETLEVNGKTYSIHIYHEKNSTRVSLTKNAINIRIPLSLSREEQLNELLQMKAWARKKLEEHPEKFQQNMKTYQDGDILTIDNATYSLKIDMKEKQSSSAHIKGTTVYFTIAAHLSQERKNKHILYVWLQVMCAALLLKMLRFQVLRTKKCV